MPLQLSAALHIHSTEEPTSRHSSKRFSTKPIFRGNESRHAGLVVAQCGDVAAGATGGQFVHVPDTVFTRNGQSGAAACKLASKKPTACTHFTYLPTAFCSVKLARHDVLTVVSVDPLDSSLAVPPPPTHPHTFTFSLARFPHLQSAKPSLRNHGPKQEALHR